MIEIFVLARSHFIDNRWLQIHENAMWYVSAIIGLAKKGIGIRCFRCCSIGIDRMLQSIQFPYCVTHLYASLANMQRQYFTLYDNALQQKHKQWRLECGSRRSKCVENVPLCVRFIIFSLDTSKIMKLMIVDKPSKIVVNIQNERHFSNTLIKRIR